VADVSPGALGARSPAPTTSINEECLGRLILLGERHVRRALTEYVAHYHYERNHQGIENPLIAACLRRTRPLVAFVDVLGWAVCLTITSRGVTTRTNGFDGSADK
jgi:hypothetical protein